MDKSYLAEVIKTMKEHEQSDFIPFLKSPYFNNGAHKIEVQNLFLIFIDKMSLPHDLKKEDIYEMLYPEAPFVEGKVEKLMVELNKLVRTYLLINKYLSIENEFQYNLDLSKIFRARGMESKYHQIINKLSSMQVKEKRKKKDYYLRQYLLDNEKHDLENDNNRQKGDLNIPNAIYNLDMFYLFEKIELFNRILLQQKVTNLEFSAYISNEINSFKIPLECHQEGPAFEIAIKIFLLLKSDMPKIEEFEELADLLKGNETDIEPSLLQTYYTYLRNICTMMSNSGLYDLKHLLFELQKEHLSRGYLYINGRITHSAFSNTVNLATRMKEHQWAYNFIETHKDLIIGEDSNKDYYYLNLSRYYFATSQFNEALDILPLSFPEPDYNNLARRLELKIYYETDSPLLAYKIDSFKMFISRASHKYLPLQKREYQNNFINLLYQITQSISKDKTRSERLIQRINAKKFVTDREWLLEKAVEIATGKNKR